MIISFWALLNESCLEQTSFYRLAAKAITPSVRKHKIMEMIIIYSSRL